METTCNPMLAMAPVHVIAVKGCPLPGRLDQKEGDSNQAWVAGKSGLSSWYTLSLNPESGVQKWCKKNCSAPKPAIIEQRIMQTGNLPTLSYYDSPGCNIPDLADLERTEKKKKERKSFLA